MKYQFKDKRSCLDDSILFCLSWMQFVVGAMHRVLHIDKTDKGDIVTMRFDMGKKWCTFFGKVHEIMFRDFKVENSTVE
ncbi:hypothetical protein BH18THE2_BH18THE2_07200 [soil metagenome]